MVDERGALSVPLAFALCVSMTFGLGAWGVLHHYRGLVEVQLRLDRCTGEKAQELRTTFERVQKLNAAIKAARATLAAGAVTLQPEAVELARRALEAAYLAQEAVIGIWQGRRAIWFFRGCGESGDRADALPALPWRRDPPDPIGPKPLVWNGRNAKFRIHAWHRSRSAAAEVSGDTNEEEPKRWSLAWTR